MYLLFDIGGTNTRMASSADGKTLENIRIIPTQTNFEQQIESLTEIAKELVGDESLESVVGGVAGSFDNLKSTLTSSPNLSEWIQKPLKEELEANFDCPVYLENDAHLGGLGEATFGAGKDFNIIAFVTLGTGVRGVRIVHKKIDVNSFGFEIGHQIVKLDGFPCNCGGKGHLESQIAGAYLEKIYGQKGENIKDEEIWDEICRYLALGLTNTILHWSPDALILGGSLAQKIPLELVRKHLANFLKVVPTPEIVKGILGHEAGLYGALNLIQSISSE